MEKLKIELAPNERTYLIKLIMEFVKPKDRYEPDTDAAVVVEFFDRNKEKLCFMSKGEKLKLTLSISEACAFKAMLMSMPSSGGGLILERMFMSWLDPFILEFRFPEYDMPDFSAFVPETEEKYHLQGAE
ncbi:MAG: hypothetical protein AAF740_01650 [Bacteroidota bacterium]